MSYTVTVTPGDLPCLPFVLDVWSPGSPPLVASRLCLTRAGAERAGRRAVTRELRRCAARERLVVPELLMPAAVAVA